MNGPVLRDIHVPPAGWWPPGPGWWVVAAVVVAIGLIVVAWLAWLWRRAPLRAALREIDVLGAAFGRDADVARLADGASRLLRRVARRVEPAAAAHSGSEWRDFVHRYALASATQRQLDALADARFRATPVVDAPELLAALRAWCRRALRRPAAERTRSPVHPMLSARRFGPPVPAGEAARAERRLRAPGTGGAAGRGVSARPPS